MSYNPLIIANGFLDRAAARGETLSPMKLQKLVYYAHGWFLALTGESLLDEPIHAWLYGPVVNSIYQEFRRFGSHPITTRATVPIAPPQHRGSSGEEDSVTDQGEQLANDPYLSGFLNRIWDIYGGYTASQLSNKTHESGTPWSQIASQYRDRGTVPRRVIIPNDSIKAYFQANLVSDATES